MKDKLQFFRELKHFYGKTGLMLSGGGALGQFHLGIISSLIENNLLPKYVAGSSSGSLIGTLLGTNTISELKVLLKDNFRGLDFSSYE